MIEDIQSILETWPYEQGEVQVRRIVGVDGRERLQMRLDMGLVQMELDGRPDGQRPHGMESLLEYHLQRVANYRETAGTAAGFTLGPEECERLRKESMQYYYRYLSCAHLEDYERVVRDTTRNMHVFDLMQTYAAREGDRESLDRFRPYVIMMRARAQAWLAVAQERHEQALSIILEGIEEIHRARADRPDGVEPLDLPEVVSLRELSERIIADMPDDPLDGLRAEMSRAVTQEDYERAALLRDEIRRRGHGHEQESAGEPG